MKIVNRKVKITVVDILRNDGRRINSCDPTFYLSIPVNLNVVFENVRMEGNRYPKNPTTRNLILIFTLRVTKDHRIVKDNTKTVNNNPVVSFEISVKWVVIPFQVNGNHVHSNPVRSSNTMVIVRVPRIVPIKIDIRHINLFDDGNTCVTLAVVEKVEENLVEVPENGKCTYMKVDSHSCNLFGYVHRTRRTKTKIIN